MNLATNIFTSAVSVFLIALGLSVVVGDLKTLDFVILKIVPVVIGIVGLVITIFNILGQVRVDS